MTVTLNIANDEELRNHIKDCIKGQVLSVVRSEITDLAREELKRKVMAIADRNAEYFVKEVIERQIKNLLYDKYKLSEWDREYIHPYVEKVVSQIIDRVIQGKDWNKLVDTLAKEKVKALIQ